MDSLIPKKIRLDLNNMDELKTCQHFVKRKKRFCKMVVAKGKVYCGEHEPINEKANGNDDDCRIVCPLDSKHTIYKKNLHKHLKICNARVKEDMPMYIKHGVNDGSSDFEADTEDNLKINYKAIKLSDVSENELLVLTKKIEKIYKDYVEKSITENIFKHDILSEELDQSEYGKETIKHLSQTASILGFLEKFDFLKNETSYIEFGAGKGQVSYWLAKLIETRPNDLTKTNVILIDRASLRHKKDNKLDGRSTIHRIRADINDLVLDELEYIKGMKHLVAIGKHLCGAATDLMLRCLLHESSNKDIKFIVSLCCHHRCEWKSFVGKEFLKMNDINRKEFELLIKMVSWGICGTGMSRERRKQLEIDHGIRNFRQNENLKLQLTKEKKEEIGIICKRVLDYARLWHMQQRNYECNLIFYIGKEITLENVCLVGKQKKQ